MQFFTSLKSKLLYLSSILLVFTYSKTFSQDKKMDSLKQILKSNNIEDSTRVKTKLYIADYIFKKNLDTILPLSKQVIKESNIHIKNNKNLKLFKKYKVRAFNNLGYYFSKNTFLCKWRRPMRFEQNLIDRKV